MTLPPDALPEARFLTKNEKYPFLLGALSFPFLTMKQASAFYELLSKISHQSKSVPSTAPPPVQVFYDCDQFPGPLEGQSSPSD